ncbi:2-isopropylmalate synthase [Pelomyxa schiedti]|nr:2-isopropylmalate synthase [Pelomyxa schiedti]
MTVALVVDDTSIAEQVYTGRLVDGFRDGTGTCKWLSKSFSNDFCLGATYEGEWKHGRMHGRGVFRGPHGLTYEGEWREGRKDGWGVCRQPDGSWYKGLWRDNHWAKGILHSEAGYEMDGSWRWNGQFGVNQMTNWGVETGLGVVYAGEWKGHNYHGLGTWLSRETGDIYSGQFDQGNWSGTGRILFGDNSQGGGSYVGEFQKDKFHGKGIRLWANGDRYEGQWKDGKEHGEGMKRWCRDGSSFSGLWEMGVPKKGTRKWPNGDQFEGIFTLSSQCGVRDGWECCGEGVVTLPSGNNTLIKLRGLLNNNTFQQTTVDGAENGQVSLVEHQMGSSWQQQLKYKNQIEKNNKEHGEQLNQLKERIQELEQNLQKKQQQLQKYEDEACICPWTGSGTTPLNFCALTELEKAFTLATLFKTQIKKASTEFVLLEKSLATIIQSLQGATQHNQSLASRLRELLALKDGLGKKLDETCEECKKALGQTLTDQSSESEIQQCSRNISELTKKLLEIKPVTSVTEGSFLELVPSPPKGYDDLMQPLVLSAQQQPPDVLSTTVAPFSLLAPVTDTLVLLRGCQFSECTKLVDQHTMLSKELSEQITLGHNLHNQIEKMQGACTDLVREHKSKWMLMRGLEGDERFMQCPDVQSLLSLLLPQAQQAIVDLVVSKAFSLAAALSSSSQRSEQPSKTSTLPGRRAAQQTFTTTTASVEVCVECDERPPNVILHPCGHVLLCSECASAMRKCPQCRAPISQKQIKQ